MQRDPQTLKERKFIAEYLATGNATEAAMRAYECSTRDSARSLGSQTLAKLNISTLLREAGLDEYSIIQSLRAGLEATRLLLNAKGETSTIPDYYVRHRYLETAIKLLDRLPADKTDHRVDAKINNLNGLLSLLDHPAEV